LIVASPNYVKKVIFPLELLPLPVLCSALLHGGVSLIVLLLAMLVTGMGLPWTVILLPIVLLPLVLAILGLMWLLGGLGVYVRDIGQVVAPITSALLFLTPIFYPVSAVPDGYRPLLEANPLTFVIESTREVIIEGLAPDFTTWATQVAASGLAFWCGYVWFQRARRGFADVL
jgi:lipopolysaccharide transport system permease protein